MNPFPRRRRRFLLILLSILACIACICLIYAHIAAQKDLQFLETLEIPDWIDVQLIAPDSAARPGRRLEALNHIVVHYVGNPGTSAQQNRSYFNNPGTKVSAHFVVGLDGEIIQCVPLTERAVASNQANADSFSIEVCHPEEDGQFTKEGYQSLVRLCAWLCQSCGLDADALIRHYDVSGKACPLYYVNNPEEWEAFKSDVRTYLSAME